jgi:putative RecB family exonuclease
VAVASQLSYSSYHTYLECPLRWKFLYIDRLPETPRGYFTFGRVIHGILEELVRPLVTPAARRAGEGEAQRTLDDFHPKGVPRADVLPMSRTELLAAYERAWSGEGYTSPEEEARYKELGRDLLLRYYQRFLQERPRPIAVEEHLQATWDGIPVHGYVDRIDRTSEGGLEVVDYKTSRELTLDEAQESDQLALYQVLVERNYSEPVERLTLYHLRSLTPHVTSPRSKAVLSALHGRMGTVVDGIRAEAFEPAPGRYCSRCDFQSRCPEFRSVPTTDTDRLKELVDRFEALRENERRLEDELRRTAEELHRAAEGFGVHRIPGSHAIAIRRREETWQYRESDVRALASRAGLSERLPDASTEEVRRVLRDPSVAPEIRRQLAEIGTRRVRWYWELENTGGPS